MIEVRIPLHDQGTGRRGELRIAGGVWAGDVCAFEFVETLHGMSGTAVCDWREPETRLFVDDGVPADPGASDLVTRIRTLLLPFHRGSSGRSSAARIAALHACDHRGTGTGAPDVARQAAFEKTVLDQVLQLCEPRKVLDVGCSVGEVVRQLRARGIEAWGSDPSPDLDRIALPDVAQWLRRGAVDALPFAPADGFDTVLAFDVFEHLAEHRIAAMVAEFARLGVQRVVARIALCEFFDPGHVTLRPLSWWDRQMAPWFQRRAAKAAPEMAIASRLDPANLLRVYELAKVPAAV